MNNSTTSSTASPPSPVHFDELIGAIAGSIGFFIICSLGLLLWIRQRRVKRGDLEKMPEPPTSPRSFVQRPRSDATGAFGKPTISRTVLEKAMEPMPPLVENPFEDPNPIPNPFRDPKDSESMRTMSSSWSYHAPKTRNGASAASPIPSPYGPYRSPGHNPSESASSISSTSSTDALLGPAEVGSSRVGVAM